MQSLIAKALLSELNMSIRISMRAVSYRFTDCWRFLLIGDNLKRQVKGIAV